MRHSFYSPEQRRYYWSESQKQERAFVLKMLEEHASPRGPLSSALALIPDWKSKRRDSEPSPWKPGLVIMIELALIWLVFQPVSGIGRLALGILFQEFPVIAACWYWSERREAGFRKDKALACTGRLELKRLCRKLAQLIGEFDEQTDRYFESDAIRDGYFYYILQQMYISVRERFEIVDEFLKDGSKAAVEFALDSLRNPIRLRCAVTAGEVDDRLLPLAGVMPVARGILVNLLHSLRKMKIEKLLVE